MCKSRCTDSSYIANGKIFKTEIDKTLKDFNVDTLFITGHHLDNAMDAKEMGYSTFVVRDATDGNPEEYYDDMVKNGIKIVDAPTLLIDEYKCPENWLQCPLSGNCIHKEKQCDGYADCNDGTDEDPRQIITNCCDEFILSGVDDLSALWHHKYMGIYEKVDCARLVVF